MQEDQEFQDLLKIMPHRHEMDVFADMITAIVIWSTILLLTAMNIVVASFEIRRCVWNYLYRELGLEKFLIYLF